MNRELVENVAGLRNMIIALDRGSRVEARQQRERLLRLEDMQDSERRSTAEGLSTMQSDIRSLQDDMRILVKLLTPPSEDSAEQGEGFLQRVFGARKAVAVGSGNRSKSTLGGK
ncbi:hypothetical protein HK097_010773 [Rhizophlyctis rosea]|uniref:Uncharacterized protein n=1 Tax=Rhizophlyctis rosea TaxID=64517 RepID=A0AAD5SK87_9FUNG|nr:hypothetical protein HK097_010773 [Rhizophlyctis rosea]